MDITELIATIPDEDSTEALAAIQGIVTYPAESAAVVRCHLSAEFRIRVELVGDTVSLYAGGRRRPTCCRVDEFVSTLQACIYQTDEAISAGNYTPAPDRLNVIVDDRPPAPAWMDLPVWDATARRWIDVEY